MAKYNYQYNNPRNQYGFSPYNQPQQGAGGYSNYNQPPPQGWGNMQPQFGRPPKKMSGCTRGMTKTNKPYVRGWKFDRTHGLRAFIAGPNKKTKLVRSKAGHDWENWTVKVTTPHGTQLYNALYSPESLRVFVKDLGLVMAPKTNYVGPFFRKRGR